MEQLVLVAKALDTDYEAMRQQVESARRRKPADSERRTALQHTRGVMGRNFCPNDANCPKKATTRQEDRRRINSLQVE